MAERRTVCFADGEKGPITKDLGKFGIPKSGIQPQTDGTFYVVEVLRDTAPGEMRGVLHLNVVCEARTQTRWVLSDDGGFAQFLLAVEGLKGERTVEEVDYRYLERAPEGFPSDFRAKMEHKLARDRRAWATEAQLIDAAHHPWNWVNLYTQSKWTGAEYEAESFACGSCHTAEFGEYVFSEDGRVLCRVCWEKRRHELCEEVRRWQIWSAWDQHHLCEDDKVAHLIGRADLAEDREKAMLYLGMNRPDDNGQPPDWKEFGRAMAATHARSPNPHRIVRR
jgi:hypothetical protein